MRAKIFLVALNPEQGADTLIYLAASLEVAGVTGKSFMECKVVPSTLMSSDENLASRL